MTMASTPPSSTVDVAAVKELRTPSRATNSSAESNSLQHAPIEYEYLTFDTVLFDLPTSDLAPPFPDLSKYRNPFDWPRRRKLTLVWISTIATLFTAYAAGMYAPTIEQITEYWGISRVVALLGITLFTVGFGIAPMVLAPFSEIAGRRPIFVIAGVCWLVVQICSAVTRNFGGMLVTRLLGGCASSTFSTMVGGVIADMYRGHDRNMPMTLFTGGVISGTGLGPLVAGFIAQRVEWRWVFYSHAIVVAILMVLIYFFFYESRGSVLLSRKARKLNEHYEAREAVGLFGVLVAADSNVEGEKDASAPVLRRIRWKCIDDDQRSSIWQMIRISVQRPFTLLLTEPVVTSFSLFVSFSWAVLYLTFSSVPYVFTKTYGFNLEQSDAVFASPVLVAILTTVLSIYQERFAARRGWLRDGPEQRLQFCRYEALCLPIGLFWFGWTGAYASVPWIVPTIGIGIATVGIFQVYLSTFNFLADSYGPYASSAIAAQSFCRNMLAGAFPLFTQTMYERLGIGEASSVLGGIAVILSIIPWVLYLYGPAIRSRSKICCKLMGV